MSIYSTVTDVLGFTTRNLTADGGRSALMSTYTAYNELAAIRPDLIHVLAEPNWPFTRSAGGLRLTTTAP